MELEMVKDPADPRRCKYSYPHEQCRRVAEPGAQFCRVHGGKSTELADETRIYHLANVQDRARLAELSSNDRVKSLAEEVSMSRMLFEKVWNSAQSETEMLGRCSVLNTLLLTCERLTKSYYALEKDLGELLPKDEVLRYAQSLCEIVIEEIEGVEGYEDIIDRIVDRIFVVVGGKVIQPTQRQLTLPTTADQVSDFPALEDVE